MINFLNKEGLNFKGVHTLVTCDARSEKAQDIQKRILEVTELRKMALKTDFKHPVIRESFLKKLWEEYRDLIEMLRKGFCTDEKVVENVIVTVGRTVFAQRLANIITYTGIISHTALGNDSTPPTVSDATLGNEVYRKGISNAYSLDNVAYLETFFSMTETNGTYEEYGMFIDGTGSADTGQLFNRFTQTKDKSALEVMYIQSIINLNNA